MTKILLKKEQADAIEKLRESDYCDDVIVHNVAVSYYNSESLKGDYKPLNGIRLDQLIKALYIGYEVVFNYKPGEWVTYNNGFQYGMVTRKIESVDDELDRLHFGEGRIMPSRACRYASPEEITKAKEEEFWESIGRDLGDFLHGDIGITDEGLVITFPDRLERYYQDGKLEKLYLAESALNLSEIK